MNKFITFTILMILLVASIAMAGSESDIRPPTASIVINEAYEKALQGAEITVIGRDSGYGNSGLKELRVINEDTGKEMWSKDFNGKTEPYSQVIEITDVKGTYNYYVEVVDMANNEGRSPAKAITFTNNEPTVEIETPDVNETISDGTLNIEIDANDVDVADTYETTLTLFDDSDASEVFQVVLNQNTEEQE